MNRVMNILMDQLNELMTMKEVMNEGIENGVYYFHDAYLHRRESGTASTASMTPSSAG